MIDIVLIIARRVAAEEELGEPLDSRGERELDPRRGAGLIDTALC